MSKMNELVCGNCDPAYNMKKVRVTIDGNCPCCGRMLIPGVKITFEISVDALTIHRLSRNKL